MLNAGDPAPAFRLKADDGSEIALKDLRGKHVALYFYPKVTIPLIKQYIAEGNNPDQPGRLVQWLYPRTSVYTWRVPGLWFDIGSKETLEEANQIFAKF